MITLRYFAWMAVLCAVGTAVPARAQLIDEAFQLGLSTSLFSYSDITLESDATGTEVGTKVTRWGIRDSVGLELGYGLNDMLVLGAVVILGGASQTIEPPVGAEEESSEFAVQVGPKL